ncbi:MAG: hypothetical protein OXH68_01105 [Gammaproteobacteria bacterium]|nr:hypothetical protein [Gammaproteobacteria bacterium]
MVELDPYPQITINGTPHKPGMNPVPYWRVVELFGGDPEVVYTVTYTDSLGPGDPNTPQQLDPDGEVSVKDGTAFTVVDDTNT